MSQASTTLPAALGAHQRKRYPAYKDAGVDWLGEIPAHWEMKRLKNAAQINPETLPETTRDDFAFRYIDISNVEQTGAISTPQELAFATAPTRARRIVRDGDTIISTVRTYLRAIAIIQDPPANTIVSTGFAVLRGEVGLDQKYLFYLVSCQHFVDAVMAHSVGVSYPAIAPGALGCLQAWLPPITEQRSIAAFLDCETTQIDALISKKQRLIALLQEKRTALITQAVTRGLDPVAPLRDSGVAWLGAIPAHWAVKALRRFECLVQTGPFGSQLHAGDYVEDGYPIVNPTHMIDGQIVPDGKMTVDDATRNRLARHVLRLGDVVFGRRGELGRAVLISGREEGWLCGTGSIMIRFHRQAFIPGYLALYLRLPVIRDYFQVESVGSTMDNLNTQMLLAMPLLVPPPREQQAIDQFCQVGASQIDLLVDKVLAQIRTLQEYRTALIAAAGTGRIDVRGESIVAARENEQYG